MRDGNEIHSTISMFSMSSNTTGLILLLLFVGVGEKSKPVEVKLGESKCNRGFAGKYKLSSLVYGYIVPFIPQLFQLLSMLEVFNCVYE